MTLSAKISLILGVKRLIFAERVTYDKTKIYKIRDIILIMERSLIKGRGVKNGKIKGPTLFGTPATPLKTG